MNLFGAISYILYLFGVNITEDIYFLFWFIGMTNLINLIVLFAFAILFFIIKVNTKKWILLIWNFILSFINIAFVALI